MAAKRSIQLKGDPVLYHLAETTHSAGVPLSALGKWLLLYWRGQWFQAQTRHGHLPQDKPDDNGKPETPKDKPDDHKENGPSY